MAVINIDDAYFLNETGAQVDKVAGLFTKDEDTTSGEKAFAQLNIGTAGSNRNLLDNPWFTVNQRSASGTVTPSAYVADRWTVFGGSATAGTYPTINASSNIGQKIAFDIEAGKTYTFSVLLADGTIVSGTKAVTNPNTTISFISNSLVELDYFGAQSPKNIRIYNTSGAALGVKAAKIELGSVSTLANDTPPDYGEELAKCQYRCVVYDSMPENFLFCRGVATGATNIRAVIDLPRSMAKDKVPTVTMTGSLTTPQGNTITAIASASTVVRGNKLVVNCTTSGLTGGNMYDIHTGNGGQTITISADL